MVNLQMTNRQRFKFRFRILDEDKQPLTALPEGASITITSSDDSVAKVTQDDDSLGAKINSGRVGTASVSISAFVPGIGSMSDTINVAVTNSLPKSIGLEIGEIEAEDEDGN